ncbi:unnamed protein product [Amaranthus hypochondriacus]
MGFLDKLWDETLAGPAPEKGLARLRKYNSLSAVRSSNHPIVDVDNRDDQTVAVSRSITILRSKSLSVDPGSPSSSPSNSSGPSSPFSPGGTGKDPDPDHVKRFIRKKPTTVEASEHANTTGPTVYDWILISALDR